MVRNELYTCLYRISLDLFTLLVLLIMSCHFLRWLFSNLYSLHLISLGKDVIRKGVQRNGSRLIGICQCRRHSDYTGNVVYIDNEHIALDMRIANSWIQFLIWILLIPQWLSESFFLPVFGQRLLTDLINEVGNPPAYPADWQG